VFARLPACLKTGDHDPTVTTLMKLAKALGKVTRLRE
jgi:hypothetical protein